MGNSLLYIAAKSTHRTRVPPCVHIQCTIIKYYCRSKWARGLRRGSAAARLLVFLVRTPLRS